MSLKKSKRLAAKRKSITQKLVDQLNGILEDSGPIYPIGGQFMLNLTNFSEVLKVALPPTQADKI